MTDKRLTAAIAENYRATVMHKTEHSGAMSQFKAHASDPEFIEAAKEELQRASKVEKQCFASKVTASFLRDALAQ